MAIAPINYIEIRKNRPYIANKRITVDDIAMIHVIQGSSVEWIVENYDLTLAEIHAALSYYYDHRDEIHTRLAQDESLIEQHAVSSEEILKKIQSRHA